MSKNFIVYQSRNRQTGTAMHMYDMRHVDAAPVKAALAKGGTVIDKRYVAMCLDHKQVIQFDEHYPAGQAIAWPAGDASRPETLKPWCTDCTAMFAKGEKVAKDGAVAKPAAVTAPEPPQAPAPTNGKRTSTKKENTQRNRAARATQEPGPVVAKTPEPVPSVEPVPAAVPAKRGRKPAVAK